MYLEVRNIQNVDTKVLELHCKTHRHCCQESRITQRTKVPKVVLKRLSFGIKPRKELI